MNNKSLLLIIDLQKNFINNETENCLKRIKKLLSSNKYNYIAFTKLCGIDTDACVLKTALDLFDSGYNVKVIENCTMSHSGQENHYMAIHLLKKLIGKDNVINEVIQ